MYPIYFELLRQELPSMLNTKTCDKTEKSCLGSLIIYESADDMYLKFVRGSAHSTNFIKN